ncbi:hypothetical protein [Laspinema olomoucense]|uniref:Uncharacterized protein n=1 Tax=Laspinema olomoucense D3b TaxID=2953688 RepID=A0ABT2NGK4_9CYAN|nr:hypothetical protein [Laspinema sp. D3b]MCT7980406.1 hypothetical protein [Laspinema sp. D3b]
MNKINKPLRFSYWVLTGLALFLFLSGMLLPPVNAKTNNVPTLLWNQTKIPNWEEITFDSLPPIGQAGEVTVNSEGLKHYKTQPFRRWQAGTPIAQVLTLGDFRQSFRFQEKNLAEIAERTNLSLKEISLAQFGVIRFQTLGSLLRAVPGLAEFPLVQIPPVYDLLVSELSGGEANINIHPNSRYRGKMVSYTPTLVNWQIGFDPEQTLGDFLSESPHLESLSLSNLPLENYSIQDVPNLALTTLGDLNNWEAMTIAEVPGLSSIPLNELSPNGIQATGTMIATVDIALGPQEQNRTNTISGSDVEGFNVPCEKECAHIELAGNPSIHGKQWISGKYQQVRGGHGPLAVVNGGMEPTGRFLFGETGEWPFKVVVWDVSEKDGTAEMSLFFRACMAELGCTPYFMGPVPLMTVNERDSVLLGQLLPAGSVSSGGGSGSLGTPGEFSAPMNEILADPSVQSWLPTPANRCDRTYQGVVLDALGTAFSQLTQTSAALESHSCRSGECVERVGPYRMPANHPSLKPAIASQAGGSDSRNPDGWLSTAVFDAAYGEIAMGLIERSAAQIDPLTGKPFTGDRLVERVAQLYFAGSAIPIDSLAVDSFGNTVADHSTRVAAKYRSAYQQMNCRG